MANRKLKATSNAKLAAETLKAFEKIAEKSLEPRNDAQPAPAEQPKQVTLASAIHNPALTYDRNSPAFDIFAPESVDLRNKTLEKLKEISETVARDQITGANPYTANRLCAQLRDNARFIMGVFRLASVMMRDRRGKQRDLVLQFPPSICLSVTNYTPYAGITVYDRAEIIDLTNNLTLNITTHTKGGDEKTQMVVKLHTTHEAGTSSNGSKEVYELGDVSTEAAGMSRVQLRALESARIKQNLNKIIKGSVVSPKTGKPGKDPAQTLTDNIFKTLLTHSASKAMQALRKECQATVDGHSDMSELMGAVGEILQQSPRSIEHARRDIVKGTRVRYYGPHNVQYEAERHGWSQVTFQLPKHPCGAEFVMTELVKLLDRAESGDY